MLSLCAKQNLSDLFRNIQFTKELPLRPSKIHKQKSVKWSAKGVKSNGVKSFLHSNILIASQLISYLWPTV